MADQSPRGDRVAEPAVEKACEDKVAALERRLDALETRLDELDMHYERRLHELEKRLDELDMHCEGVDVSLNRIQYNMHRLASRNRRSRRRCSTRPPSVAVRRARRRYSRGWVWRRCTVWRIC